MRGFLVLLILLLSACGDPVANAPGIDSAEYRQAREQMVELYRAGRLGNALRPALTALLVAPTEDEPYAAISSLYVELGDDQGAAELFEMLIKRYPRVPEPWQYRGFHEYRRSRWDEALAAYRQSAKLDPVRAEPHFRIGLILQTLGAFDEAADALRQAHRLDPENAVAAARLARVLRITGSYDEARAVVDAALTRAPDSHELHYARGMLLMREKDDAGAEAALRRAIELDDRFREAHFDLARLLRRTGREEEGLREAAIAEHLARYADERERLTREAAAQPGDYRPALALGQLELSEAQTDEALRWLERARALGAPAAEIDPLVDRARHER